MRLVLDQGLAPRAAELLCEMGMDAVHVSTVGLDHATDEMILEFGRASGRTCVTLDHDFHRHLADTGHGSPSVILLRVEGMKAGEQAHLVQTVILVCGDELATGAAVSADRQGFRLRRLPLR